MAKVYTHDSIGTQAWEEQLWHRPRDSRAASIQLGWWVFRLRWFRTTLCIHVTFKEDASLSLVILHLSCIFMACKGRQVLWPSHRTDCWDAGTGWAEQRDERKKSKKNLRWVDYCCWTPFNALHQVGDQPLSLHISGNQIVKAMTLARRAGTWLFPDTACSCWFAVRFCQGAVIRVKDGSRIQNTEIQFLEY